MREKSGPDKRANRPSTQGTDDYPTNQLLPQPKHTVMLGNLIVFL
jgi:hypothetical protein